MKIRNNIFDKNGRTFQEIIEQFLLSYYNEMLVKSEWKCYTVDVLKCIATKERKEIMVGSETYKVGIYLRLSREDNKSGESGSISGQRDIIHRYIKDN